MNTINATQFIAMFEAMSESINQQRDYLNKLDSALGDGDHGTGISTAFSSAVEELHGLSTPTLVDVLKIGALTIMNRMGGASGALFGSMFLKGALTAKGKSELSKTDMDTLWTNALEGVKQRGKSEVGDKTMVDALEPAVTAYCAEPDMRLAWHQAALAAREGAKRTETMIAKHGRAKFSGERSVGHQDAGANTVAYMFESIDAYWQKVTHGEI